MGQTYNHLSLRERVEIDLWRKAGRSLRWIGLHLGRSAATISREVSRNAKPTKHWRGVYEGERAHALAQRRRRWDARFKLARQPALRALVRQSLGMGYPPRQTAGRAARAPGPPCALVSGKAVRGDTRPSRSPAGWRLNTVDPSSAPSPSIASSTIARPRRITGTAGR